MPLIKSTVSDSLADFKLAVRPFYAGNADSKEIARRTITQGAALQQLKPVFGVGGLIGIVSVLVERFNSLFNFHASKKMTSAQIEDIAAELVLDFLDRKQTPVTLEEMAVFFDRAGRNEFINPKNGRPFIFDRIDKSVIYEMLDFYFEDEKEGRTAAVWSLQDEKEMKLREINAAPPMPRMTAQDDATPLDFEKWATEGRSHLTGKGLLDLHKKYGGNE